ncbi:MAG: alpha/beta hydrolase [Gudongella sp.]|nr:alpha/beta hydrolase [Gudongella sp.]
MSYIKLSDGTNIFYNRVGKGHAILCIHGFAADHTAFRLTEKTLGRDYNIITLDLRGHGKSDETKSLSIEILAKDLDEIISKLGLKDFSILGWSMGGSITLEYIKEFGTKNLGSLILVETSLKIINDTSWKHGLFKGEYKEENLKSDLKKIDKSYSTWGTNFLKRMAPNLNKKDFEIAAKLIQDRNKKSMQSLWKSLSEKDYSDISQKIDIPTLIIKGEKSEFYSLESAQIMAHIIKGTELKIIANAGHLVPLENPVEFARVVREFINNKNHNLL